MGYSGHYLAFAGPRLLQIFLSHLGCIVCALASHKVSKKLTAVPGLEPFVNQFPTAALSSALTPVICKGISISSKIPKT